MSTRDRRKERFGQESVVEMNSYLEVDVARWLSANEVPFAYEPFVIPGVLSGTGRDVWDLMTQTIHALGERDFAEFDNVQEQARREGSQRPFATLRSGELLAMWEDIYDKHRLANEAPVPPLRESLSGFRKEYVLPDMALYPGVEEKKKPEAWEGWDDWEYLLEVGGLYGVGIPEDGDVEWWQWYRVAGVAFKELIYRFLGLWEFDDGRPRTIFVVPFQPPIEGVDQGTPQALFDDDNYVVFSTTRAQINLGRLADRIGVTAEGIDVGLSPAITPTEYRRPSQNELPGDMEVVEYDYDGINLDNLGNNENAVQADMRWIVFHGELGEVFISPDSVHVKESQFKKTNLVLVREYVLDVLSRLQEDGIVEGLSELT